jgi:hypothetical protein
MPNGNHSLIDLQKLELKEKNQPLPPESQMIEEREVDQSVVI